MRRTWIVSAVIAIGLMALTYSVRADDDAMSDDPQVERRLLQLPPGFDIELYASEPDIVNPVTINFDSKGRLWVLCLPSYPQILPGQEGRDFITIIDPPDAQGHPGKSHRFVSNLSIPTAMVPGDGGVYVGESDSLVHLKDTDGDGQADVRRVLLTGFGTQDMHHAINTMRWGPDGKLYFNQGEYIQSSVETPFGLRRQFGGAIWQFNPQTLRLEIFDRSIFPSNTWGHIFDPWGTSFIASAWVSDINLVLPDTPLNTSNDPDYIPPLPITRLAGDRHSGVEMITGRQFPPEWQGNLVTGGFASQQVNRIVLKDDGEHFSAQEIAPLVISKHRKFRPVDMKMGPDGALYVSDWYNLIIQHNQVDFRDPRRDHDHGRIWRITYKGRPLVPVPDLTGPTPSILDHLKDPEQWTQDQARRVLAERDHKEVADALAKWVAGISGDDEQAEHELVEALWVYESIDTVEPDLLKRLLQAKNSRARDAATAVLGNWQEQIPDATQLLATQAKDQNMRVRLGAVLASQMVPSAKAFDAALDALDRPTDAMLNFELKKAALVLKKYWYPAYKEGSLTFENDPRKICFALLSAGEPEDAPKLLTLLQGGRLPPNLQTDTMLKIAAIGDADQIGLIFNRLLDAKDLSPADRARVLDALARASRDRKIQPANVERVADLLDRDDELGVAAIRAVGIWKIGSAQDRLKAFSEDPSIASERRQAGMGALVAVGSQDTHNYLLALTAADKPFAIRADAVAVLVEGHPKEAARAAAQLLSEPSGEDVAPIYRAILHRKNGDTALVEAFKKTPPSPAAAQVGIQELAAAALKNSPLAQVLMDDAKVAEVRRAATPEVIQRLASLVASEGNASRGEKLFRSNTLGCMRCHAIAGAGGNVGPDLAAIGNTAQVDFLIEHVLAPGRHIKDGYSAFLVQTASGDSLTGVQVRETADELVLRDTIHDEIVIPKSTIKSRRSIGTLMPTGIAEALSDAQFADLVRFLSELGKPGPFTVSHAPVARRWWMLSRLPANSSSDDRGKNLLENKKLIWGRAFSNVAGDLPLSDVAIGQTKSTAIVRCAANVISPGKTSLTINNPNGISLWIDGVPQKAETTIPLDLSPGRHTFDFWIDLSERKTDSLRCELAPAAGSTARVEWAPN